MSMDRKTRLAVELYKLGVSKDGVVELLSQFSEDEIEQQLIYLPYRKAKRQEAFIVEAIRKSYSPPKEYFYAQTKADLAPAFDAVDQGAELPFGSPDVRASRYGTENSSDLDSQDFGVATTRAPDGVELPNFDGTIR